MTVIDRFDPASTEARSRPWEFYRWLRDEHPMYFVPEYDMWFVSRFGDIWRTMGDATLPLHGREVTHMNTSQLVVHNKGRVPPDRRAEVAAFPNVDPPHQGMLRGLVNQPFRPGAVRRLEDWFRDMVRSALPALLARGTFNLTDELGVFSTRTMMRIAGLPEKETGRIRGIINEASDQTGDPGVEFDPTGMTEIVGMLLRVVAARRAAGADGTLPFIDKAVTTPFDGRLLDDIQIVRQLMTPLVGGIETLPKVTAHTLWELRRHPEQLAAVRADLDGNAAQAFEEGARFCGPAQSFHRTVTQECHVLGETLLPGQRVAFLTASAGRDEREFPDPDEYRWDRPIQRTLAFGQGDHFCMGIHLARMEGRVLLQEFLSAVDDYEIDEANARRTASTFQQGWDHLPIRIIQYRSPDGLIHRPGATEDVRTHAEDDTK